MQKSYRWSVSIALGIFFLLFMAAFLPFGVSNYDPKHQYTLEFMVMLSWFMLANIAVAALLEVLLKPYIVKNTHLKQIVLWNLFVIIALGLTSYLIYNIMGNWHDWSLTAAIGFVFDCGKVLIFPQLGVFFFFRFKDLQQQYWKVHSQINQPDRSQLVTLKGQGANEEITLRYEDLIYLQAQDNYVAIYHIQDQEIKMTLVRSSLTQLINQLGPDQMMRCHRSFAVNPYQITAVKGRVPQQLRLAQIEQAIPVSKTYRPSVSDQLQKTGMREN